MNANKWSLWIAMLAASCLSVGCGGDGGTDAAAAAQAAEKTPAAAEWSMTKITHYDVEPAAAAKPADAAFAGKDMAGLLPNAGNGYFNSGIKLLISAVGPQKLVDHLQHLEQQTEDPSQRLAASRFIALIHTLYQSDTAVSAAELMESLQVLAPFNAVDQNGLLETELKTAALDPIDFLEQLGEPFKLQELSGRVLAAQGAATAHETDAAALFHAIPVPAPTQVDVLLPLQQALGLLGSALRTADIAEFTHLTILPPADGFHWFQFTSSDQFTLPVFDEKRQQAMLVTLAPKAQIMLDDTTYHVFHKDQGGIWNKHYEAATTPLVPADAEATIQALTLQVVSAVPMP